MSDWMEMLGADVLTLGMAADDVRRSAMTSMAVTYLRVHEVTPHDLESGELSVPPHAAEVRLYETPGSLDEATAQLKRLKAAAAERRVVAFSWADIEERGWVQQIGELVAAGLDDVAELPVDKVPDIRAAAGALAMAGAPPRRLTTSHPVGDARVEVLRRAQQAFATIASLRRYSPLPRVAPVDKPTTGYEDVRMVALARLALPQRSIEVDWKLYGPKLAQVALTFGADHVDAVSAVDDMSLGPRRATVEDVRRNIRAAGFEPSEVGE